MADAVVLVATAPKSNSAHNAIIAAMDDIRRGRVGQVPRHLQNVHADSTGSGMAPAYRYPHDYPNHYVRQQYLPYELSGREFYQPGGMGYEVKIKEHMQRIRREAAKTEQKPQDGEEQ